MSFTVRTSSSWQRRFSPPPIFGSGERVSGVTARSGASACLSRRSTRIIYSGGNDVVTLDVGSSTVNSLTVGGPSNGFSSELTDGGTAQTLCSHQWADRWRRRAALTLPAAAARSPPPASRIADTCYHRPGATLNLTSQPNGVTSVAANSTLGDCRKLRRGWSGQYRLCQPGESRWQRTV